MKLKSIIFGSALFTAGILSSDWVKHKIATVRTDKKMPRVSVQYTVDAAFVNGQRVYADTIGEARCDWELPWNR